MIQTIINIIFFVVVGIAIFFWYEYEKANEDIYELELRLDEARAIIRKCEEEKENEKSN